VSDSGDQRYRAGVDIGGTFTDLILVDDTTGELTVGKVLTTPGDPSSAVADVLSEALSGANASPAEVRHVIHGTTLVTNAVIERKGARTALLTTRGFRDAYEIAREHRYDLYDLFLEMPTPLVPRYLRLEVDERMYADGTVAKAPDLAAVARLVAELRDKDIEAIAVCFVHSYANPAHEQLVATSSARSRPTYACRCRRTWCPRFANTSARRRPWSTCTCRAWSRTTWPNWCSA